MRERAEELGGSLTIEPAQEEGGTRVLARLPLPAKKEGEEGAWTKKERPLTAQPPS
jgi:hypothetical protein